MKYWLMVLPVNSSEMYWSWKAENFLRRGHFTLCSSLLDILWNQLPLEKQKTMIEMFTEPKLMFSIIWYVCSMNMTSLVSNKSNITNVLFLLSSYILDSDSECRGKFIRILTHYIWCISKKEPPFFFYFNWSMWWIEI